MTKDDKMRRLLEVSDVQRQVVESLIIGNSITAAAEEHGVARQTVSGWANHHPGFKALLNARREECAAENQDVIRSNSYRALQNISSALLSGDIELSLQWCKLLGPNALQASEIGPTTAEGQLDLVADRVKDRHNPVANILENIDCSTEKARRIASEEITSQLSSEN